MPTTMLYLCVTERQMAVRKDIKLRIPFIRRGDRILTGVGRFLGAHLKSELLYSDNHDILTTTARYCQTKHLPLGCLKQAQNTVL